MIKNLKIKAGAVSLSILLASIINSGCSNGSIKNRNEDLNWYGHLKAPVETGPTFTTQDLQSFLSSQVCQGLETNDCNSNLDYIRQNADFGHIDVSNFVTNNPLNVPSVTAYKLVYNTIGVPQYLSGGAPEEETVSGVVLMPNINPHNIKGVILYYHATLMSKLQVPSNFSPDNKPGLNIDKGLAAIFASQGFIVVIPDYLGQGVNTRVVHPYAVYPDTNAKSGIYMLTALREFLNQKQINLNTQNLYLSSYSEGGSYALWASKLLQGYYKEILSQNNLNLKHTVGISGSYDLSDAMLSFAFTDVDNSVDPSKNTYQVSPGSSPDDEYFIYKNIAAKAMMAASKINVTAYAFNAYINYNGTDSSYTTIMSPKFVNMSQCLNIESYLTNAFLNALEPDDPIDIPYSNFITNCSIGDKHYNFPDLFKDPTLKGESITTQLLAGSFGTTDFFTGKKSTYNFYNSLLSGYTNNSIASYIDKNVLEDYDILSFVKTKNIYNWTTNNPVSLVYLHYDSVVPILSSLKACGKVNNVQGLKTSSQAGLVDCIEVDNTRLFAGISIGDDDYSLSIYMDHPQAEMALQLVALNKILNSN